MHKIKAEKLEAR